MRRLWLLAAAAPADAARRLHAEMVRFLGCEDVASRLIATES